MVLNIKDNGKKINEMEKENSKELMEQEINFKDNIPMIKEQVKVHVFTKMDLNMKENGKKENIMAMVYLMQLMVINIQEIGLMAKKVVKASMYFSMVLLMMVNLKMIKEKEKEYGILLMVIN